MVIARKVASAGTAAALLLVLALPAGAKKPKPTEPAAPAATATPATQASAQVIRETPLKTEPFADAETVSALPANAMVQILMRQGAWMQVRAGETAGWLRLLSLRTAAASTATGDSGLTQAINVARSGASGNTVATGVRGLSKEQIANAAPNTSELARMGQSAADEAHARAFAAAAPAASVDVPFLEPRDN